MFQSIKYRFILIYVVLVAIAMSIVATFIVDRLEKIQVENATESMIKTMDTMATTTTALLKDNMENALPQLDKTLKDWGISSGEAVYILSTDKSPMIIASTRDLKEDELNSAYAMTSLEPKLIMDALDGKTREKIVRYQNFI